MPSDILILIFRILSLVFLYGFLFVIWRAFMGETRLLDKKASTGVTPIPFSLILIEGFEEGHEKGKVYPLTDNTTIGRSRTNSIILNDAYVSTLHASINYENGLCMLTDHESRNGTHINDIPVNEKTALATGDRIKIGQSVFEYISTQEPYRNA